MIKVVLAVTNDIVTDNRIHKIAVTLQNSGYKVTVVGRKFSTSQNIFGRLYKTRRFKLWFNKSVLFYANYNMRLFFYLLKNKFDIIVSNDLDTLPGCWFASIFKRELLVFDSHELFTELPELVGRPVVKKIWSLLEKILLPRIKFGYTVSKPIQEYYKLKYNKDFELIRNVSLFRYEQSFKGFPDELIVIYQGSVNLGRGLGLMIDALNYLDGVKLWIVGQGGILDDLKKLSIDKDVEDKVIFFGRISIDNLWRYTSQAHIGISLEEDLGLNYRYALPNKLFDYIQSRVPVIVSDLPEMSSLVGQYKIGRVLKERDPKVLADTIKNMSADLNFHGELQKNLELAARDLCWQREEESVILLYRKVCGLILGQNDVLNK